MDVFGLLARYGWILALVLIAVFYKVVLRVFFGTVIVTKEEIGILSIVAGGGGSQGGTLVDVLLANLIRDNIKPTGGTPVLPPPDQK